MAEQGDATTETTETTSTAATDATASAAYKELEAKLSKAEKTIEAFKPQVDAAVKAEQDRVARAKEKEEQDRIKKGEAENLIKEKDAKLTDALLKLESFEKRDRERADEIFAELPEEAQAVIGELKDKLSTGDWLTTVEKHAALVTKEDTEGKHTFIKPKTGTVKPGEHQPQPMTKQILEDLGRGEAWISKLRAEKDPENPSVVRFGRQIKQFFADMNKKAIQKPDLR
jgi:hypothetical protein